MERKKNFSQKAFLLQTLFLSILFLLFSSPAGGSEKETRPNFLLITLDTLRADRLSCYGSQQLKTPNIDSLAENGILFSRAFASTPTTLPSHASILLGTTPLSHGVHDNYNFLVKEEFLTLAEHLKNYGYSTGAFLGGFPLDSRFGLAQGFDIYDDDYETLSSEKFAYGERKAEEVLHKALAWLKDQKSPWFVWMHFYDPHDPYEPPEPFKTQYSQNLYDGEVAYVDLVMGRLVSYMKEMDLFGTTLVILTADHGESLGEHGEETHGYFAYNATIWVPLIISFPGLKHGIVRQQVSHVDIFPTVCDILNAKKLSFLEGYSLLQALKGKKLPRRPIYFESLYPYYSRGWAPIIGYIFEKDKFIDSPIPELYDIEVDFDEVRNIAPKKNLDRYKQKLSEILKKYTNFRKSETRRTIDRESLEKLGSLGYITSPMVSRKESYAPKDDVKTLLPYHNRAQRATDLYKAGKTTQAINSVQEIISERKDVDAAYDYLAHMLYGIGRSKEALEVLERGLENLPSNYKILSTYVDYLLEEGMYDKVIKILGTKNLIQMGYDPEIWISLGYAYWKLGDLDKAIEAYEKALTIDNEYVYIYHSLGIVYLARSQTRKSRIDYQKSLDSFKKAIEIDPKYVSAYKGLGDAYLQGGNLNGAIYCWEKTLELNSDLSSLFYSLSLAYLEKGDKVKALDNFIKFKEKHGADLSARESQDLDSLIQKCKLGK